MTILYWLSTQQWASNPSCSHFSCQQYSDCFCFPSWGVQQARTKSSPEPSCCSITALHLSKSLLTRDQILIRLFLRCSFLFMPLFARQDAWPCGMIASILIAVVFVRENLSPGLGIMHYQRLIRYPRYLNTHLTNPLLLIPLFSCPLILLSLALLRFLIPLFHFVCLYLQLCLSFNSSLMPFSVIQYLFLVDPALYGKCNCIYLVLVWSAFSITKKLMDSIVKVILVCIFASHLTWPTGKIS